jgi:predicted nucleic acid-binding protein
MSQIILLDETPLSQVTHPRIKREVKLWLSSLLASETVVKVPEIVDYELRRELLRQGKQESIQRLDEFVNEVGLIPITRETMKEAAELWAWIRKQGKPTAPDPSLDADVILATQAILKLKEHEKSIVITANFKHISRFCEKGIEVFDWKQTLENFH